MVPRPAPSEVDAVEVRERPQDWQRFAARFHEIETNVERVVRGKHAEIRLALVALIAEGHLLIEDVPGVGKTMLAKAIARSIDCSFRRIQFTPDLLPTDVTGVNVFNQEQRRLRVQAGRHLRQHRAGRRDQPGAPEDAVGAPGVHGGAAGHGRHRDPPPRHAVHGDRHAEPDRARGHVPAARGAARPVHAPPVDRLPDATRSRPRSSRATARGTPADRDRPGERRARRRGDDRAGAAGPRGARHPPLHRRPRGGDPPALRHVPRGEPARLDHDPAGVPGHGGRRRARLRDPRRREGARRPGARPPDHRDGGRRHERPLVRRSSCEEILAEVPVPVAEDP